MKILSLELTNFRGIKSFKFEPNGNDVSVLGDNGVGKTTLFDSFTWLLFGKDSQNKAEFAVETLDANGDVIHGLDHSVEGVFDIEGTSLTLKRNYHEVWTKGKQGESTMKGHTTDYWIDGVPGIKETEYKARIAGIIDEQTFRLLTDPRYFNEVLPWEKRREALISIVGDISIEDVIATDKALAVLPDILGNHKTEDYKKVLAARRKAINEELDIIPKRIDEVTRGLPEVTGTLTITTDLKDLKGQRNKKAQELVTIEAGGGIAQLNKELAQVEADLIKIQKDYWLKNAEESQAAKIKLREVENKAAEVKGEIDKHERQEIDITQLIASIEVEQEQRRITWHDCNKMEFTFEQSDTCPTCLRKLPKGQVEAAREKALAAFNVERATRLEKITAEGKAAKDKVTVLQAEVDILRQTINDLRAQLLLLEFGIAGELQQISSLEANIESYQEDTIYIDNIRKKQSIERQIADLKVGNIGALTVIKDEIQFIDEQIAICEATIAKGEQRLKGLARIEELKADEKRLSAEYEKLQRDLFIIDKFSHARVELLTERINSKFQLAKFKMFDIQVNGEIDDRMCETLVDGVPYSTGLNRGACLNVGLDIINTLSEFHQFDAPIWIDNAESTTDILSTRGQQIKLIKPEITDENRTKYSELVIVNK